MTSQSPEHPSPGPDDAAADAARPHEAAADVEVIEDAVGGAPADADGATPAPLMKQLGPSGLLGIAWLFLPALGGFALLYFIDDASAWLQSHGLAAAAVYVAVFTITAGFGLLPTYAQAVLGGWAFGTALGIGAALAGFTGAALVGWIVARTVSRDRVRTAIAEHPRARVIHDALVGRGPWRTLLVVTLVRVPPNSPFALTNLVLAGIRVPLPIYVTATVVGMTPRTAVVAGFAAAAAAEADGGGIGAFIKEGPGPLMFGVGLATMIAVLMVIGTIANRALAGLAERD